MGLRLLTPEQRDSGHRKFQEKFSNGQSHEYRNVRALSLLDAPARVAFRDRVFEAQPVSVEDGFTISELICRWDTQVVGHDGLEAVAAGRAVFREATVLLRRLLVPLGMPRWLWRRVGKNPFADATEGEFVLLLRFLSLSRMR